MIRVIKPPMIIIIIVCEILLTRLVEHASESLIGGILSLLFLLDRSSRGISSWGVAGGGGWTGRSVSIWVGNAILELINLGPAEVGGDGDGQDLLVAVHNGVYDRWKGREVGGQRDSSNGRDGAGEGLEQLRLLDIENTGWEGVSVIVDLRDTHTVGEGGDVQHVEKGSLGSSDLGASLDELQIGGNFDGTTGNLSWDTEGLEERGLSWFHTSVSGWDENIIRGYGTSTSRSSDLVGENLVTDGLEVAVGEDESDVALDEWKETLVLGGVGNEALDSTTDHGVLSHQDDTLTTEGLSDLVHLLGADIVNANDEDAVVLFKETLELVEVAGLVL